MGILVFLYSLGEHSARGFAYSYDSPPVIGISTTWDPSVRVYTLIHELGHILTGTSSSCIEEEAKSPTIDPIERWCEGFAASFLMPRQEFEAIATSLQALDPILRATRIANKLLVSRRLAMLRLIEVGRAEWGDFQHLAHSFEKKKPSGKPVRGLTRTRDIIRKDKYGSCLSLVYRAYQEGLVSEADIRTYLRMFPEELR